MSRGGKRKGSGRKPVATKTKTKLQVSARIKIDIYEWVRNQDQSISRSISDGLELLRNEKKANGEKNGRL